MSSFEAALRDARIAQYNLVHVSSIFPPFCKVIPASDGIARLKPGQVVAIVMARNETDENHRLVASAVGAAIPAQRSQYGYLSEHHSFGETDEQAGDYAEELAAEMLCTILNVPFDPDAAWSEKKKAWMISGKIVRTTHIAQSATGQRGLWTTTLAAAMLIP